MRDAKGMPEHDTCVVDRGILHSQSIWKYRGKARCLQDVAAGGIDLLVVIWEMLAGEREVEEKWAYI